MKKRSQRSLLIVFTNLNRYTAQSLRVNDREMADTMDIYYELTGKAVTGAGGTIVKFIGDGALPVFPEGRVESAFRKLGARIKKHPEWNRLVTRPDRDRGEKYGRKRSLSES